MRRQIRVHRLVCGLAGLVGVALGYSIHDVFFHVFGMVGFIALLCAAAVMLMMVMLNRFWPRP